MSENRTFKRFPDNDYTRKLTSHFSNSGSTPVTTHYESPGQVPRRRGQILVFLLLAALLAGAGYLVWNSFIRYEAYGVVEANIVGLSSPVEGEIRRLNIQYGQRVEKDQVVAEVVNTDDLRDIAKIDDEINVTQAEIKAKRSELLWKTSSNNG